MSYSTEDYWAEWQAAVVALIQIELADVLPDIQADEVDRKAWQPFFDEGCGPR